MTTKHEDSKEFWKTFRPPNDFEYLTDEAVLDCLRFVRDRTLSLLVEKARMKGFSMSGNAGILECIGRCHQQMVEAVKAQEVLANGYLGSGVGDREISIGYEKELPRAQDIKQVEA